MMLLKKKKKTYGSKSYAQKPIKLNVRRITLKILKDYLVPKLSYQRAAERSRFRSRIQRERESTTEFVRQLHRDYQHCTNSVRCNAESSDVFGIRDLTFKNKLFEEVSLTREKCKQIVVTW